MKVFHSSRATNCGKLRLELGFDALASTHQRHASAMVGDREDGAIAWRDDGGHQRFDLGEAEKADGFCASFGRAGGVARLARSPLGGLIAGNPGLELRAAAHDRTPGLDCG